MDSGFQFPPGFRFHPSDEELIVHYLLNKVTSNPLPASIIAEIDLYKYNPWELPKKALFGEEEWYFFSPRDRKYPKGTRPNRAAASGYWKATGTDRPIVGSCGSNSIGVKKALVFYIGRPPKGIKTEWIMNEYRLPESTLIRPSRLRGSMRLDDWVLCRVRQRGSVSRTCSTEMVRDMEGHQTPKPDMVGDYLYRDCRLLASILAGHTLPPDETISSVSFEGTDKINTFTNNYQDIPNKIAVAPFTGQPNPLTRKLSDDYNLFVSNKKLDCGNKKDMNHYGQNHFQHNLFNSASSDSVIDFQEFNEIALPDRYLQ